MLEDLKRGIIEWLRAKGGEDLEEQKPENLLLSIEMSKSGLVTYYTRDSKLLANPYKAQIRQFIEEVKEDLK